MNRWTSLSSRRDDAPPVELRFIDLFMAMIGCLIFLAMLLSILPRAGYVSQEELDAAKGEVSRLRSKADGLEVENKALKARLGCSDGVCNPPGERGKEKWFPGSVTRYWVSINVIGKGCAKPMPDLYVRYTGKLFDSQTGKQMDDAKPFNPADVVKSRTKLDGDRYDVIRKGLNDVELRFFGVRAADTSFVYLGFERPLGMDNCVLTPRISSAVGDYQGSEIVLTAARPFGLLAAIDSSGAGGVQLLLEPYPDNVAAAARDLDERAKRAYADREMSGVSAVALPHWVQTRKAAP